MRKAPSHPDCFNCTHFYITWDKNFPKGCRAFNIKSMRLPSIDVAMADGRDCHCYTPKAIKKNLNN
jgi:hypothetical protein